MYIGIEGAIRIAITVMILVFVILSLLALLMIGLREAIKLTSKKQVKEEKIMIPGKGQAATEKAESKEIDKQDDKYKEELIAVISAAVSSYMEVSMKKIKIISINRNVPAGVSPWTIAGKQNLMSSRISISSRKRGGF
jgi:Na+-transporting methylmalonyl-CoA/oxaloacetate decarboxylase gamma subunit